MKEENNEVMDDLTLQQFLKVYRVTLYTNIPSGMSPKELMFVRKIRSVFDKQIPSENRKKANDKCTS